MHPPNDNGSSRRDVLTGAAASVVSASVLTPASAQARRPIEQEARMTGTNLSSEVRTFFEKYSEAFASYDGRQIAALYHMPTVTMRGDASIHCLQSRDDLAGFFQTVVDTYRKDGYAGGTFENLEVIPIGGRSVLASMDWVMLRSDGSIIRKWRQSYNLVRVGTGWQILVSTFHLSRDATAA